MPFNFSKYFSPILKIKIAIVLCITSLIPEPSLTLNVINVNIESLSAYEEAKNSHSNSKTQYPPSLSDLVKSEDIKKIRKDLPDFQRPDFKQIPYLIQRVNLDSGITEYLLPPEEPGQAEAHVAFSRHSLDTHLSVLIFPTGHFKWQQPVDRKYVVLRRHSKKTPIYFFTLAYVRQTGVQRFIEWSIEELSHHTQKTKIEQEICRGEICDLPEWILGTCTIVSNKCNITLDKFENETIYRQLKTEEIDDPDDDSHTLNFNGGSSSSESNEYTETGTETGTDAEPFLQYGRRRKRSAPPHILPAATSEHIPSSLDLLFLNAPAQTHYQIKAHAKRQRSQRSLDSAHSKGKHDHDHNIEEILHILKCRNCQKLGNFYGDLEEEVAFNHVLGEKFGKQFNSTKMRHWRRFPWMKRPTTRVPYIGYGDCSYISIPPDSKKPISNEMDDVIEFYLDTLRLECNTVLKNEIRGWLTSKIRFLRIVQDLSFEIIPNSKILKYSMLTPPEFEMLMSALLFFKYSSVYRGDTANKSPGKLLLLGHPLSAKVSFLTKVFMKVIDCANRYLQHHMIKISQSLARNLKDKFYALMLEKRFIHLKKAARQAHLNKENYRDRIQIMALKEFLLYGLSPIFRSGTSTEVAFKSFYQLNENRIRFLVHSYGIDAPQNK